MKLSLLMLLIRAAGKKNTGEIIIGLCRRAESCTAFSFGHSGVFVVFLPETKHEDNNTISGKK